MQLPSVGSLLALSLSVCSSANGLAVPVETTDLAVRQLGGGPGTGRGTAWKNVWTDTTIKAPGDFGATRGPGCQHTVTFLRDPQDTKYKLRYYANYGTGEARREEEKTPINLQFTASVGADGRQVYSAFIQDACSTFFTDRPAPDTFLLYFTESQTSTTNYVVTFMNAP